MPVTTLTNEQLQVVTFIEQKYHETGKLATNELIAEKLRLTVNSVKNMWKARIVREALTARGVSLNPDTDEDVLTPTQIVLANILLNTHDRSSIRKKLELVGVSSVTYNGWMRQPAFSNYLKNRVEDAFKGTEPDALLGIKKAVEGGDLNAIKFYLEMVGRYNPKLQIEVSVDTILTRVVEVVSKYVPPEIMEKIADELEGVTNTKFMPGNNASDVLAQLDSREKIKQAIEAGSIEVTSTKTFADISI